MMSSGGGTGQLFIIVYSYHLFLWHHFANFQGLSLSLKQPNGNLQAGGYTLVGLR